MELDLDTFLTAVYCVVDDLYRSEFAPAKPRRRGHRPELADSEVLALVVLAQWQRGRSERAFLRDAGRHWRGYFPRLLSQSAFNRRARDLAGVLCALGPRVAERVAVLAGAPAYEALDGVPVPLMRRCRGTRHRLFADEAGIGCGGSDRDWYYGVELVAAVDPSGAITGFVLIPAGTEERWGVDALLRWRADPDGPPPTAEDLAPFLGPSHRNGGQRIGPTGPIAPRLGAGRPAAGPYLADRGERGAAWRRHWRDHYGAAVLTKADYPPIPRPAPAIPPDPAADRHAADAWGTAQAQQRRAARWLSGRRQVVETAFHSLTALLGLPFPRARSSWGLLARTGAKVAAHNLLLLVNLLVGRPAFSTFDPLA
jgi:hypothetical protein